jgi:hypothetical protein
MLTILNDPAGATGRRVHALLPNLTLQRNIEQHLESGGECALYINGLRVDPTTDPRLDQPVDVDAEVMVVRRPGFGIDLAVWAIIAAVAAAAVSYALMPKIPGTATGKDSPNNQLTAQSNVARAYQAIPDVYGYRRVWPDLIQPSTVEYFDHIKYVTEWMCVSRGVGDVSAVQYAESPIGDIDGASYEIFGPVSAGYPELGSTTIADVLETFPSDEVNGQEIAAPAPFALFTRSGTYSAAAGGTSFTVAFANSAALDDLKSVSPGGTARVAFSYGSGPSSYNQMCTVLGYTVSGGIATFTFTSSVWSVSAAGTSPVSVTPTGTQTTVMGPYTLALDCNRIRWNTAFLRGLKGTVAVRAEWWRVGVDGAEIAGTREHRDDAYTADTFDQRFWTTEVVPSAGYGRYRVQFTRSTDTIGTQGNDVAKLDELYAVRHYAQKVLPGVTVIRVTTKATNEATGFSDRKFNVRWQRHVRRLDSDIRGPSRNFARAMAHIWTIAGNEIAQLDTATLGAINAQHGEDSPLLRFDMSLDDADMSLGERLQTVANTARCVVWRDGLKWTVTRDQARPYPQVQLDYRNLAAAGESSISYAAHLPASNDGVELEYVDEPLQAKKAYIRLNIRSGMPVAGVCANPKKIKMPGCTTQAQAMNRALLEARRLLFQRVSVEDTALADGGSLGPGSLVRWIDPNDFGGDDGLLAGEVLEVSGDSIRTSEPLDFQSAYSGRILFTGVDGRHLGPPVICYPASNGWIRLAAVPLGLFVADDARQCGSRYAFAVGVTDAEMEASGLFTVTEVKPAADRTTALSLAQYDQRLYASD